MLISLAQKANYEYPELAGIALEVATDLLPEIEDPSFRSMMLQNLVRTYRNLEGEVGEELIREGFILADDMRQQEELKRQNAQSGAAPTGYSGTIIFGNDISTSVGAMSAISNADRLEVFLVSELARDSFNRAIAFTRTIENDALRLEYLIQVAQKLCNGY